MSKDVKKLVNDALESFIIIKDLLALYYQGKQLMFKPIAGQLRILYCDTNNSKENSLLHHIYPDLMLIAFREYEFKKELDGLKIVVHGKNGNEVNGHDRMCRPQCFCITQKSNGLQIADIDLSCPPNHLPLKEWCNQVVDSYYNLTVKDIIRSVADKGGGSHIDLQDNRELSLMKGAGPAGVGLHTLFIIALARYTIKFAKQFEAEWVKVYPDIFESKR